ncbi:MAG: PAS domain-containing sensor histidine kinase [Halobacteriota archaeon]
MGDKRRLHANKDVSSSRDIEARSVMAQEQQKNELDRVNVQLHEDLKERVGTDAELTRYTEQLEQYKAMIDLASDGIIVRDLGDRITYWNKGAASLYGWSAADAQGKVTHSLLQTVHPLPLKEIRQTLFENGRWEGELTHTTQTGERIIVESHQTVYYKDGEPAAIFEINTDITERKRVEDQLHATALYTRGLIETSLDPLVTISAEGTITDVNKATEEVTGRSRDELIGSDFSDYFTEPDKARQGYRQVFSKGFVRDYPLAIRHRSGATTDVLYNATVYRNEAGDVQGVFAAARDITEQKRAEEELRATSLYARNLIEASLDPLVTISADGRITDANRASEDVTGRSRDELIGSDFSDYFTEPDKAQTGYQQVFADGFVRDYPLSVRHKSGSVTDVLYNATVYRNEAGDVQGVFAAARDITEQKRIEQKIRDQAELLDLAKDAVVVRSLDHRALSWNKGAERLFGWTKEEALGKHIPTLLRTIYPTSLEDAQAELFEHGHWNGDVQCTRRDGTQLIVEHRFTLKRDDRGNPSLMLTLSNDVTERIQAEQRINEMVAQLERTNKELARSNADLKQFAYVASHDLQEPLRAIVSYVQLLDRRYKGQFDERADRYITHAVEGGKRMQTLINDLLTYSRVETRAKTFEQVDMEEVFADAIQNLKVAVEESGAQVTHAPLPRVNGDDAQLTQVFQNLIGNAIKFRSDRPPEVYVAAEQDGDTWRFSVKDNGIGIGMEYADRIFTLFQRLHTRRDYSGTGIGLAICKRIVERHGGQIWVESIPGSGSTFYFTLPNQHIEAT